MVYAAGSQTARALTKENERQSQAAVSGLGESFPQYVCRVGLAWLTGLDAENHAAHYELKNGSIHRTNVGVASKVMEPAKLAAWVAAHHSTAGKCMQCAYCVSLRSVWMTGNSFKALKDQFESEFWLAASEKTLKEIVRSMCCQHCIGRKLISKAARVRWKAINSTQYAVPISSLSALILACAQHVGARANRPRDDGDP